MIPAAKSNDRKVAIDLGSLVGKVHIDTKTEYLLKNNILYNKQ